MEPHIGSFVYDSTGPVGPVYAAPVRTNMTYDAVPRPASQESPGFVYDSAHVHMTVAYDGERAVQTYDLPFFAGLKATNDPGPIADEPTIVERNPEDPKDQEP